MADSSSSVNPIYAEIIVVRHGETKWNADGRIQVANRLGRLPKISAIYSSDLKRASETAEIIAACSGRLEVIKDPDLRERHLGDLHGLLSRETAKVSLDAHKANRSRRTDVDIPGGGESLDKFYYRCTSALQRIGRKHAGERVVVVTQGGVKALHKRLAQKRNWQGRY